MIMVSSRRYAMYRTYSTLLTLYKVKRCIMERDLYPRRWGLGPVAVEKKKLKSDGKLDKFGRPNENTPAKWQDAYTDFNRNDVAITIKDEPAVEDIAAAAQSAVPPNEPFAPPAVGEQAVAAATAAVDAAEAIVADDKKDKKRKKHDGETEEEKAERKRRKAEKKEKKA